MTLLSREFTPRITKPYDADQTWLGELEAKVRSQKTLVPSLYGDVDFDLVPERFTTDMRVKSMLPERFVERRAALLAKADNVRRIRAYTMLGDTVADAYAALVPEHGARTLIDMLVLACERGIDAVPDAPPELQRFIASMEALPGWIDPKLSAEGARYQRVTMAFLFPMTVRGSFLATFTNKYSGLPMALTGSLASDDSGKRVKETASFFTTVSLPGAMRRFGPGFRAAAMVRMMHAMVRAHLLMRARSRWEIPVHGIPIPQLDQMPAGMVPALLAALAAEREKRDFTRRERALVELSRHQCFLLGLPSDLLRDTPEGILDTLLTYGATLRDGYDDTTNGALVRATMGAYLGSERDPRSQALNAIERRVSKVWFYTISETPRDKARRMHVLPTPLDYAVSAGFYAAVLPRVAVHMAAARIPILERLADRQLVAMINDLLASYGHPEYTTNPEKYRTT